MYWYITVNGVNVKGEEPEMSKFDLVVVNNRGMPIFTLRLLLS